MSLEILVKNKIKVPYGDHVGKRIIIGSDHRGYELKEQLKQYLKGKKIKVVDVGTDNSDRTNYPEYSYLIAEEVSLDKKLKTVGIGICGSGIGMTIPAGKHKGVYPARCLSVYDAKIARNHNNTNYLSIAADQTSVPDAKKIVDTWLTTLFYTGKEDNAYLDRFVQTVMFEKKSMKK